MVLVRKAFAILGVSALVVLPASAALPDAATMLKEIDALKPPVFDQALRGDEAYWKSFRSDYMAYLGKRSEMVLAFYKEHPKHERTLKLMDERFSAVASINGHEPAGRDKTRTHIREFVATQPAPEFVELANYHLANVEMEAVAGEGQEAFDAGLKVVDAFESQHPKSSYAPRLLMNLAFSAPGMDAEKALMARIVRDYPDSLAGATAKAKMRQFDGLGKPFELSFTDAISGKTVTMADLKGKVVLVDFWATWCGPCVADMPELKKLYAEYHEQGLEVVGVSLDQPEADGGLKSLKEFVAEHEVKWPQYYQGNGWESEFSKVWGINSIPSMFLVDRNGILRHIDARIDRERKVKELLAETTR